MHTPGCQAALVAIAPAFSGAITGLTFFFVAICGMINPAMTKWIVVVNYFTFKFLYKIIKIKFFIYFRMAHN